MRRFDGASIESCGFTETGSEEIEFGAAIDLLHWRNERGETWRTPPLGDRQRLWIASDGEPQICVRSGPVKPSMSV